MPKESTWTEIKSEALENYHARLSSRHWRCHRLLSDHVVVDLLVRPPWRSDFHLRRA